MLDIKAIDEICEKNNFYDKIDETMWSDGAGIMISQSTPEGEDWSEDFNWDNDNIQVFIDSLKNRIDGWDSEEEAMPYIEMRGQRGVPSSIRDLLNDADWKLEQLKALYTDLINYDANNNYKPVEKKTEALDYVKAAKQLNDISTEEIVGYLVKNKDCDARLKDIWEKYLALNKLNVALDDDKYIELDNAAEKIIEELSGLDLLEIDESKQLGKKTEARLTDYLGIMEIRDILQQNPATADKEFAILDDMKVEVGVGDDVKTYKAIKNDEGNWELLLENKGGLIETSMGSKIQDLQLAIARKRTDDMLKAVGKDNFTGVDEQRIYRNVLYSLNDIKAINSMIKDYAGDNSNKAVRMVKDLTDLKSMLMANVNIENESKKLKYADLINYDANNNYKPVEKKTEGYIIKIDKDGIDGYWGTNSDAINNNNNVDKLAAKIFKSKGAAQREINKYKHEMGNAQIEEVNENKSIITESASYNDFVKAGESLWGEDCSVYDTVIDGIFDCSTAGHGGYLVDTTIFPELAKYGEESSVANIVGFEEDYEALKVLWVFPQLIKSEDFKNKLNLDMVLAYDEDKSFAKEFPTMGGNIVMNENKLEEKTNPYTFEAGYYEWLLRKNGKIIKSFGDITENLPEVCNRKNLMDFAEELVYLSDLDTDTDNIAEAIFDGLYSIYGEDLQESKKCVKEEKTKLNFIENVDELPDMCYGVLPSDNSIIIIKKGERGYFLTNKDYERAYANIIDWNLRNDKANEICDKLNAELGVTPDQRFTMEIRSMNGNWGNKKAEESKKLQEEITTEEIDCAKTIADIIYKKGIMNWIDVDEMVCDMLKLDCEDAKTQDIVNDVYGCLTVYNGLGLNNSTGDFYTQEYADKHPEVLEESKDASNTSNNNIADTFKNYEAFKNNFEDIIIVKSPYNKNYLIYNMDSKNDDDYIYYSDSKDNIEGWLAGAVKANNNVIKPRG